MAFTKADDCRVPWAVLKVILEIGTVVIPKQDITIADVETDIPHRIDKATDTAVRFNRAATTVVDCERNTRVPKHFQMFDP